MEDEEVDEGPSSSAHMKKISDEVSVQALYR